MENENAYDAIARWYDLEHHDFADDLDLYRGFAEATGSPVLELGCGSGRVLVPLAESGFTVTGIDRSKVMLGRARDAATLAGVAGRVTLMQSDMASFQLPTRDYRLAFVALGSFQHLARLSDRRAMLSNLRTHVVPGATVVLDLAQSELRRLSQFAELGQIAHVGTWTEPESGEILTHSLAVRVGPEPATLVLTHWYDAHTQGGPLTRVCVETTMAAIGRAEIELLLEATGWRLRHVYGDHDMGEWDESSSRLIVIAQAAE